MTFNNVEKVTDPAKVVTDQSVIDTLNARGIDPDYVEFYHDYGPKDEKKGRTPYMKNYRDLKSNIRIAKITNVPKCKSDGTKLKVGFLPVGDTWVSDTNLLDIVVDGTEVTIKYDPLTAGYISALDYVTVAPRLYVGGIEQYPSNSKGTRHSTEPNNGSHANNLLDWAYTHCIRRVRIIQGRYKDKFIFTTNPEAEVKIDWVQTGTLSVGFGSVRDATLDDLDIKIDGTTVTVSEKVLDNAVYPVEMY